MTKHARNIAGKLPPLRHGAPAPAALIERREMIANSRKHIAVDPGVTVVERQCGGVSGLACSVPGATRTILHLHGGGYRLGDPRTWVPFAAWLARVARAHVFLPDYRLAPEHPFPAAIHDAVNVYADLAESGGGGGAAPLVSGDSAGGGLAAALVVALGGLDLAPPPGLLMISPWLDLTVESGTFASRAARDKLFSREAAIEGSGQYLQGHSPRDPLASPLFADVAGFPPTQIFAGGEEVLLGDTVAFAARLAEAGVSVESHVVAGMQHVWPTVFPELPESVAAMEAMARFADRVLR